MLLEIKVNGRVMVTTNIDLSDRLFNGQIDSVKYNSINQNDANAIYVAPEDVSARKIRIDGNDLITRNKKLVSIKKEEISIYISNIKITSPVINKIQFQLMLS